MHKLIAAGILGFAMVLATASLPVAMASGVNVPTYRVDTAWPKIPNNWSLGAVAAVAIGPDGHVWVLHRPRTVAAGTPAAPPVLEFAADGSFLRGWGGPGTGYEWPVNEHSITLDKDSNVWISGNGAGDDALLKFTRGGKLLLQFGHNGASTGNADHNDVKQAAGLVLFAPSRELLVADGYGNRRVIVFDANKVQFKRLWGAFGNVPEDWPPAPPSTGSQRSESHAAPLSDSDNGSPQFALPHAVVVSNDRMVYVADRPNRRVQVFSLNGTYLRQVFINRAGPATDSACGLALSTDPAQRLLYVADYGNSQILILDRKSLAVLNVFGSRGEQPGQFRGAHSIALGKNGILYVSEVAPGNRVQRFLPVMQ